ncbi:hypothetical protein DY000_02059046 [Brassica cretica]|uniref:RNase H type-1 domain-containing protein n=1 Tax=Brassica cretica TaxID=69181 RepID=A0ABQ7AVH8_BRACR|nr:hypothetical protein DY000_02059046 [Brassica cretica]
MIITVEDTLSIAIAAGAEWSRAQTKTPLVSKKKLITRTTQPDCVRVRSDAAWHETKKVAGIGWTTEDRSRLSSFSLPERFVNSPLLAEGLALRAAILHCREL